ncbi:MAG: hypothetical protein NZM10_04220, partial [Fimbriimonadales bacterium]|nr:hypothetical protein [Fimbriimonadales bacterium]
TLLVTNRGNAYDALSLRLKSFESSDASRWNFALFEQRDDGSGFHEGLLLTDSTSPLAPGQTRRLYLRARPPGDRNTDGALLQWLGVSQLNPSLSYPREFVVGVEASRHAHTSTTTWASHQMIGEPVLIQGRLHWLTWNGQQVRLFRTPNPLSANTPFSQNVRLEARINIPAPTHNTLLLGDQWYLLTQSGRLMFFQLSRAQGDVTLNAVPVPLPDGVVPDPSLPLIPVGNRLCFVDRQHRIWLYNPVNFVLTPVPSLASQPITTLSALSDTMFGVGRADGRVDIYQQETVAFSNLRIPGASGQAVRFIGLHENTVAIVAGARMGVYHLTARKWHWICELDSPPVAPPVRDSVRGVCYVLTENGWLYGINHWRGGLVPLYPQQLFGEVGVARAALGCLARADRQVPYLYLQARLTDGSVRVMLITAENPLNRFVNLSLPANAPVGTRWLFTGNQEPDLALCWIPIGAGSDGTSGAIYGFRLR